ncbi:MAG: pentapeptide repeat-containing protein [Amylibacter sp.]
MRGRRYTSSSLPPKPGVFTGQEQFYEAETPENAIGSLEDDLEPAIGHNSAAYDEAPEEKLPFVYRVPMATSLKEDLVGEVQAFTLKDAFRELRLNLFMPILPEGTTIRPKSEIVQEEKERKSHTLRFLLRALTFHHDWLVGDGGERADLSNLDLRTINLSNRDLSHADIGEADLEGAVLKGAILSGANLSRANLRGADLSGADLRNVDLSEANLQGANLTRANLNGVDLYRANLKGCTIEPERLHQVMDCMMPSEAAENT